MSGVQFAHNYKYDRWEWIFYGHLDLEYVFFTVESCLSVLKQNPVFLVLWVIS